jgi:hypothetical protein
MQYLISIAAGLAGGIAAVLLFGRRRSRRRTDSKNDRRKIEFSKLVLSAVLLTYFAGFVIGARAVAFDPSQLGVSSPMWEPRRQRQSAFTVGKQRRKTW